MSKRKYTETSWKQRILFIFAFVGFIWSTVQIYDWVSHQNDFNIEAKGYVQEFYLPKPYEKIIDKYRIDELSKDSEVYLGDKYNTSWKFSLKHLGNNQIENLDLLLPFDGYYTFDKVGEGIKEGGFDRKIHLGTLKPAEELTLKVWSNRIFFGRYEKEIKFTHPGGIIEVQYPLIVSGSGVWLYQLADLITLPGAIILILGSVIIFIVVITDMSLSELALGIKKLFFGKN